KFSDDKGVGYAFRLSRNCKSTVLQFSRIPGWHLSAVCFGSRPKRRESVVARGKRADVPAAGMAKSYGFAVAGWCAAAVILAGAGAYLYFGASAENLGALVGSVQVVGSESMHPSVTACAEDFMTRNPQADVIVRGGGSGDGVAALLHGI